jgi:hypothetical protein
MPDSSDRDRRRAREAAADRERADEAAEDRATSGAGDDEVSVQDFSERFTDFISGQGAAEDAAKNEQARRDAESTWRSLYGGPDVGDLTAEYAGEATRDEYGDLGGSPSALESRWADATQDQRASMQAMRSLYEDGGYTDADRMMSRSMRDQQARQMGSMNQAAMQGMQARGMGGSGAELAMRMQGGEAMAGANAQSDAMLGQSAQQRAWQALQGWGDMGNASAGMEMQRRQALDAYNSQNMDWRRGREQRNTSWANQGEGSRVEAERDRQGMNERAAAMGLGQYQAGSEGRRQDRAMMDQATGRSVEMMGSGLSAAATMIPTRRGGS